MKKSAISGAFQQVLKEAPKAHVEQAEQREFYHPESGDKEGGEGYEEEPSSMADLFRRHRDKSRQEQEDGEVVKKKKKKTIQLEDSDDDAVDTKVSIPKNNEKKKEKAKAAQATAGTGDEEDEEGEEENGEEGQNKVENVSDLDDEDEAVKKLLSIDESSLVNRNGQPLGPDSTKHFKVLKQRLAFYVNRTKQLRKEKGSVDPVAENDHKQLKEAHETLKKKHADMYFEESEEWKSHIIEPLTAVSKEMGKWLGSHDHADDEDSLKEIAHHRAKLEEALTSNDDVAYYEHVDTLADFLKKGASSRFRSTAPLLWDAFQKKEQAFKDKEGTRTKLRKESYERSDEESKKATNLIETSFNSFEEKNKEIIKAYKTNPHLRDYFDYEGTVLPAIEDAKASISDAVKKRIVSPALTELVVKGALFDMKAKEQIGHLQRIEELEKVISRLEGQVEQKSKTIKKFAPSRFSVTENDDDDDEDDSDQPKSMAELYKRRRDAGLV